MSKPQFLLLAIVTFVAVVALQNLSPSIAIAFLGRQTIVLPLGVWVLLSVAVGAILAWTIAMLFRLAEAEVWHTIRRQPSSGRIPRQVSPAREPFEREIRDRSAKLPRQERDGVSEEFVSAVRRDRDSDIEEEEYLEEWDDWEEEEYSEPEAEEIRDRGFPEEDDRRSSYEVLQEPTSVSRQGSVYSYSYRPSQAQPDEETPDPVSEVEYRVVSPLDSLSDEEGETGLERNDSHSQMTDDRPVETDDDWQNRSEPREDW